MPRTRRRNTERRESREEKSCFGCEAISSRRILRNLVIMVPCFYIILYSITSVVHASFKLQVFDPRTPFNFKDCCLNTSKGQALGISLIITYFLSTLFFLFVTLQRFWDHVITLTIFHILLTALVMLEFPTNWQWWIAILIGFVMMISFGELLCFCIEKRKKANITHAASSNNVLT